MIMDDFFFKSLFLAQGALGWLNLPKNEQTFLLVGPNEKTMPGCLHVGCTAADVSELSGRRPYVHPGGKTEGIADHVGKKRNEFVGSSD